MAKKKEAHKEVYKLISNEMGHKFSFHAKDQVDAENKKRDWCSYHSLPSRDFTVEESHDADPIWIHNEYMMN
jgi:hypothetical protein